MQYMKISNPQFKHYWSKDTDYYATVGISSWETDHSTAWCASVDNTLTASCIEVQKPKQKIQDLCKSNKVQY